MNDVLALGLAVLLLAGNAFFVGAEFALISVRREQLEPRVAAGSRRARTTLKAVEQVSLMMAGAQLGITICSLGLGAVGEPAVAQLLERPSEAAGVPDALLHPIAFTLALMIVVGLHMVLGEMVPKNIAIAGPVASAMLLGPALYAVVRVLRPVITGLNAISNGVLRLLKVTPTDEVASTFTADQVHDLVAESHGEGLLDEEKRRLLAGAIDFESRTAADVVVRHSSLVTVTGTETVEELHELCARSGYSRFPVRDDEGLRGYVHVKDLAAVSAAGLGERVAPDLVRGLSRVRGDDRLGAVLSTMRSDGSHLGEVVDAAGASLGVVMLEDVLEELVGEVRDTTQRRSTRAPTAERAGRRRAQRRCRSPGRSRSRARLHRLSPSGEQPPRRHVRHSDWTRRTPKPAVDHVRFWLTGACTAPRPRRRKPSAAPNGTTQSLALAHVRAGTTSASKIGHVRDAQRRGVGTCGVSGSRAGSRRYR